MKGDLENLPGFNPSAHQFLAHVKGKFLWLDIVGYEALEEYDAGNYDVLAPVKVVATPASQEE